MAFTLSRRKQGKNISYIYRKIRFTTVKSHVNGSESNNLSTSNNNNVIGNKNFLVSMFKQKFHVIHSLICKKKPIQIQVLVSMMR